MLIPWWVYAVSFGVAVPNIRNALMPMYKGTKSSDKTIVITGATGRLGKTLSYDLALRKCRLILGCRDLEKCKIMRRELVLRTKNKSILCRKLDLEDIDSINAFADQVIKEETYVDVLIHNAAIKSLPEKQLTEFGIEKMYFVNFLAPFYLTMKLHGKLLDTANITGDSRVVINVGDLKQSTKVQLNDINFERRPWTSQKAYGQSKLALAYYTILLDQFSKDNMHQLYVYGTNPIGTNIFDSLQKPLGFMENMRLLYNSFMNVESAEAVQTMALCSLDIDYDNRSQSGKLYSIFLTWWRWPKVCNNLDEGRLVWNHAIDTIDQLTRNKNKNINPRPQEATKPIDGNNTDVKINDNVNCIENSLRSNNDSNSKIVQDGPKMGPE